MSGRTGTARKERITPIICIDEGRGVFRLTPPRHFTKKKGKLLVMTERRATGTDGPRGKVAARPITINDQAAIGDQNSTRGKVRYVWAENPTRFLIPEGRYEAECIDVCDPFPVKCWRKWQTRFQFNLLDQETPGPLTKFLDCGRNAAAPIIDGKLRLMLQHIDAEEPSALIGRKFLVDVETVRHDRQKHKLPRHERYSVVRDFFLLDAADDEQDKEEEREQWRERWLPHRAIK